jgi:hypothetical protein
MLDKNEEQNYEEIEAGEDSLPEIEEAEVVDNIEEEDIEENNQNNIEENTKDDETRKEEISEIAHATNAHTSNMMHQFMQNMDLNFSSFFYSNRQLGVEGLKTILNKESNHGLTGMKNMGNSCYINTVIQCLSHSIELTYYFLAKLYINELNKTEGNQLIKRGLSK